MFASTLRKFAYANYMATQTALLGTDYTGYNISVDTTDIDRYVAEICSFPPDTSSGAQVSSPSISDLIEYGANYVLYNIEGVANIAINEIVSIADVVG